ncbi:Cell death protease [Pyricularia grisea]|uniref:Pheromone-processing carboxypeptidase KEX1 n=1 Tax=Pyricularia grisea TaxID=148305 RepID=A0A6P8AWB3_PYRGI|nr:uncharacterized protein PgNI_08521 [Pyricularia grisea]KAI6377844.1 Cell death protease [Pyricularia grisea]TLD06464.1 hypothetical protein PgNI_08521 [Pyricularia grisea]
MKFAMRRASTFALIALSWSSAVSAASSAGDYFVRSLPGAPPGPLVKMHAGHIEVTPEKNGNMFFWHFQNKHIANRQRTVIWLNGGPGCSSEDGALMEVGPYRLKDDHTLVPNEGSWHEFANIMFVDNPVGTGFSYVNTDSYVTELDEMADQFIIFLEKFFELFPEYSEDDLYIAGESFAGQHIPYIAKHILERNKNSMTKIKWNLKGLLIGNGWIAPNEQYRAYLEFSYAKGLLDKNSQTAKSLEAQYADCLKEWDDNGAKVDVALCESVLQNLLKLISKVEADGQRHCVNMYDVRLRDTYPSCGMNWPPDLVHVTPYLRRKDVVEALHVNPNKASGWTECTGAVGKSFKAQKSKPSIELLPKILEEVPILLFSGAEDLICNHMGTEAFIGKMTWNGGKGFELTPGTWAPRRDWTFEGKDAGFWQEARNLTYVLFKDSSHMVPFDYPRRSRDMLDRFMGVDISSIGGNPTDSRLDGEKLPETTVGGAAGNSTSKQEEEKKKLDEAKWYAYRKSGEVVLVIVAVAAAAWGWYIWRDRRRRRGYQGIFGGSPSESTTRLPGLGSRVTSSASGLEGFRSKRQNGRDVEAGDFDESELDDLHAQTPTDARYSVGGDSDDEEDASGSRKEGGPSGGKGR